MRGRSPRRCHVVHRGSRRLPVGPAGQRRDQLGKLLAAIAEVAELVGAGAAGRQHDHHRPAACDANTNREPPCIVSHGRTGESGINGRNAARATSRSDRSEKCPAPGAWRGVSAASGPKSNPLGSFRPLRATLAPPAHSRAIAGRRWSIRAWWRSNRCRIRRPSIAAMHSSRCGRLRLNHLVRAAAIRRRRTAADRPQPPLPRTPR